MIIGSDCILKDRGREGREGERRGRLGTQKRGLMLLCGVGREGRNCLIRLGKYVMLFSLMVEQLGEGGTTYFLFDILK